MKNILIIFLQGYKFILSPFMTNRCRFYPTCSNYGIQAIHEWGPTKGLYFLLKRLLRCHPFANSGIDFVPKKVLKEISTDSSTRN